jgi:hypothetical protein
MQKKHFLLRCCGILTALAGFCATEAIADEDSQITILHVQGRDVRELGKSLDSALSDDDVRIQIDAETNILMLKGSKKAVEKTAQLLKVLDPIPRTVTINIEISVSDPENSEDGDALQTPTTYTLVLDTTLRLEKARVRRLRARYRAAQVFAMRRLRCRPASVRQNEKDHTQRSLRVVFVFISRAVPFVLLPHNKRRGVSDKTSIHDRRGWNTRHFMIER